MHLLLLSASLVAGMGSGMVIRGDPAQGTAVLRRFARDADGIAVYGLSKSDRVRTIFKSSRKIDAQSFVDSIGPLDGGWACACMPPYEVEFLQRGKPIGSVWLQEMLLLYVGGVRGSLQPKDAEKLAFWFAARDVFDPLEEVRWMNDGRNTESRASNAVPLSMRDAWKLGGANVEAGFRSLYPKPRDRIRALLTWYGAASGPYWATFQGESLLEDMFRKESTADLVAVFKEPLSKDQMHGAARWASRPVPAKLEPETAAKELPFRWTIWDSFKAEVRSHMPGYKQPTLELPRQTVERKIRYYEREVNRTWLRIVPPALRTLHVPTDPITDLKMALPSEIRTQLSLHVATTRLRKSDHYDVRPNLE